MEVTITCKTPIEVVITTEDAFVALVRSLGLIDVFEEGQCEHYIKRSETTGEYESEQGEVIDDLLALGKAIFPGWEGTL